MLFNPLTGEFDYVVDMAQTAGDSSEKAMSQKAVTEMINDIKDAMGEIPEFSSVVEGKISYNNTSPVSGTAGDIIYSLEHDMFLYRDSSGTYYKGWSNVSDYMDGDTPKNGTYKCGGQLYVYKDGSLQISQSGGAGLESVENLPYDNLYEGRSVTYNGRVYVYHNDEWTSIADDLGHRPETHPEEFLYQPTASDLSVKDGFAKIQSIKGKTLVWNQWADAAGWIANTNGINETAYTDGVLRFSINHTGNYSRLMKTENFDFKGHKILLSCQAKCNIDNYEPKSYSNGLGFVSSFSSVDGKYMPLKGMTKSWKNFSEIIGFTADYKTLGIVLATTQEQLDAAGGTLTFEFKDVKVFDLTQMFGEGNEPATVEEFEAMFPASNYEYNAGELLSHDSTGIKTVGFNQWDEEWEKGTLGVAGLKISLVASASKIRSKNYIRVVPGKTYNFSCLRNDFGGFYVVGCQDVNGNGAITLLTRNATSNNVVIPNNVNFIKFSMADAYGTTYNNDICINLSHSGYRNGEYQPYEDYVTQWAEGKKISELTSNGVVVFPHGLMSAGDVYDEITKDSAGKSIAIKRCEADTANLTTTALETPVTYVLDDDLNLSYKVWDFGTEEILAENLALPFKGDIEYGFNAVDMIRNNYFAIKEIKEKLLPSIIHQQLPKDDSQCLPGIDTLIWSVSVPAKSELHARVTVKMYDSPSEGSMLALGIKNTDNVCLAASCAPLPTIPDVGHTVNITHWFEEETRCVVFIRTTDICYLTDKCPVGDDIVGASELIIKTFGE